MRQQWCSYSRQEETLPPITAAFATSLFARLRGLLATPSRTVSGEHASSLLCKGDSGAGGCGRDADKGASRVGRCSRGAGKGGSRAGRRSRSVGKSGDGAAVQAGMLVIAPCRGIHTRGMKYPIDLAFVDATGRVVRSYRGIVPHRKVLCPQAALAIERESRRDLAWFKIGDRVGLVPVCKEEGEAL